MKIEIRYTEDCPNLAGAEERVRQALREVGAKATITRELVASMEDAERLGFIGSPTIIVDGTDPFPVFGAPAALACRIYRTAAGPAGSPSVEQLREAIEGAR